MDNGKKRIKKSMSKSKRETSIEMLHRDYIFDIDSSIIIQWKQFFEKKKMKKNNE